MPPPLRVLVVDDALDYAEMVVQFLKVSGEWADAAMEIAATYEHAIHALTTEHYDVAFVDYWLGARDGLELLRDVRSRGIDTAIVILTAYGAEDVAVQAMKAGAADYLPKTQVSVEELDRTIRHALALRAEERQRHTAELALRASEERFRALVEHSSDGLLLIDLQGRVQYMAPSSTRRLGWTPEEVVGRSLFDFLDPDDRDQVAGAMSGPLSRPGGSVTVEVRAQHAQGGYRILEVVAVNHADEPAIGAIVVNARDVTERRRLEEQLRHSQKMEALGQLAGGVSHDFTNLLTAILGYCELALSDLREDDPLRRDLEEIRSAGERAASLTRQLLAFARRQTLQPQIVDVNALIRQIERLLGRLLSSQIDLSTTLDPNVARVKVDPASIEQTLVNLAVHARDAMPQGGKVTIETGNVSIQDPQTSLNGPVAPGRYVLIAMRETSDGMDAETHALTVHATIAQNGGHMQVESASPGCTVFKILLPPAVAAFTPRSADSTDYIEKKDGWETILVVEADDAVRALTREVLRRHGYVVLEARHGVDALRLAERQRDPIQLLMTDTTTPHMSGRDIAERLVSARPGLKVLFVSEQSADESPADDGVPATFLRKPFTPDALARTVRVILDS